MEQGRLVTMNHDEPGMIADRDGGNTTGDRAR